MLVINIENINYPTNDIELCTKTATDWYLWPLVQEQREFPIPSLILFLFPSFLISKLLHSINILLYLLSTPLPLFTFQYYAEILNILYLLEYNIH